MAHYKAHQGTNTKSHICRICNLAFNKKLKLDEHLSAQHNVWTSTANLLLDI